MNARSIALIISFAAIAMVLNTVRIPTIYWPGFSYYFSEIPIVVAFLLFGINIGFLVEVVQLAGQMVLFPAGPAGLVIYPMGFVAVLLMFAGLYVASRFTGRKETPQNFLNGSNSIIYLTTFAVAFRGAIMPLIDYGITYRVLLPLVLGVSIPETYIAALVPAFVLFNVTVPLYTIPVGCLIARRVSKHLIME
jgi:riboflavin transporter FmnP